MGQQCQLLLNVLNRASACLDKADLSILLKLKIDYGIHSTYKTWLTKVTEALTEVVTSREEPMPIEYSEIKKRLDKSINKFELELANLKSQHRQAESPIELKLKAAKDSLLEVLGP